ncbi:hypothetical protein SanaruYs_29820 [Chryseotalea sanaruensis]|uniref:Uncharacterized protein n=2 Tax=Chryseotalea sanaruensis TaxID=2482724 RepID=A0A401UCZ0_9BACT|nr:hypothetical protein SanaruYs_29820 [Chryseotalea sanaruensis]
MHQQLKQLQDEELTKFIFTEAEFEKAKVNSHEIKVGGKMYDIARTEVIVDRVHVYALHDEAEDSLLTLLSEITSRVDKDKKPVPKQLMKLILLKFIKSGLSWSNVITSLIIHHTHYHINEFFFISSIDVPPPRS